MPSLFQRREMLAILMTSTPITKSGVVFAPPTLNAKSSGTLVSSGGTGYMQTLTFVHPSVPLANDIIVVDVSFFTNQVPGSNTVAVTGLASTGANGFATTAFQRRFRGTLNCTGIAGTYLVKETWWAVCTVPVTLGDDAQLTLTTNMPTVTYGCVGFFSVTGANTTNPWDASLAPPNAETPSTTATSTHDVTGVTSSGAAIGEFIIASITGIDGGDGGTVPVYTAADTNYTLIASPVTTSDYLASGMEYYTNFTLDFSSATVDMFQGGSTTYDFIAYVDGIVS
jgi:hypothetical protein